MTVSYSLVVSSGSLGTFFKLLARWRGSIFKVVYREGLVYFAMYTIISLVYRFALSADERLEFENVVVVCRNWSTTVPVTFILGFYVTVVFNRWRMFVDNIPWIDNAAMSLVFVAGGGKAKEYRRLIVRWLMAAQVLCLRATSVQVKNRFPFIQHLVDAELLSRREAGLLSSTETHAGDSKHWLPMAWATRLLHKAFDEGLIKGPNLLSSATACLDKLREKQQALLNLDWINIPLVYTQLVSLAVWANFGLALVGNQWVDPKNPYVKDPVDLMVPVITMVQFVCFVGWLRVAQSMLNPLGERDDDLELNFILDRNLRMGMHLADILGDESGPPYPDDSTGLSKEVEASSELPHTLASRSFAEQGIQSSATMVRVSRKSAATSPVEELPQGHRSACPCCAAFLGRRRAVWAAGEGPDTEPTARP